jgi:hypothetical protein
VESTELSSHALLRNVISIHQRAYREAIANCCYEVCTVPEGFLRFPKERG